MSGGLTTTVKLKYVAEVIAGQSPASEAVTAFDESEAPFLQGNAEFGLEHPTPVYQCAESRKHAEANDVLVSVRAPVGAINEADRRYGIGRGLNAVRAHSVDSRFLRWFLLAQSGYLQSLAVGSTFQAISADQLKELLIEVVDRKTQVMIAGFLDREIAQIDELIAKQEQLIRLANERVQAEMDSLFGQFERTTPLRRIIATVESGTSVNAIDTPISHGEIGVLKTSSVSGGRFDFEENKTVVPEELNLVSCPVREGMVIVSRMNTPRLVGAAGYVEGNVENLYLPDRLWQMHIPSGAELFWLWTRTTHYRDAVRTRASGTSASMKNISQDHLMSIQYPQIPHEFGVALVRNLREGIRKTDTLVSKATEMISLLKERRRALITAAVTGKIDVTGKV